MPPTSKALGHCIDLVIVLMVIVTIISTVAVLHGYTHATTRAIHHPIPTMATISLVADTDAPIIPVVDGDTPNIHGYVQILHSQDTPPDTPTTYTDTPPDGQASDLNTLAECMHDVAPHCYLPYTAFAHATPITFAQYLEKIQDHPGKPLWITQNQDGHITTGYIYFTHDPMLYTMPHAEFPAGDLQYYLNDHEIEAYHIDTPITPML